MVLADPLPDGVSIVVDGSRVLPDGIAVEPRLVNLEDSRVVPVGTAP
jgi:hypothetical protein